MDSTVELKNTSNAIKCTDHSLSGHDAIEYALTACLAALAELASAAGQAERAIRLRNAAGMLSAIAVAMGGPTPTLNSLGGSEPKIVAPTQTFQSDGADGLRGCPLTTRELEVVGLVVHGLTNRQIAEKLVISERTADSHMQNILNKLGLTSRAQVAAWFVEHKAWISRGVS